jgi:hypothetical protein
MQQTFELLVRTSQLPWGIDGEVPNKNSNDNQLNFYVKVHHGCYLSTYLTDPNGLKRLLFCPSDLIRGP